MAELAGLRLEHHALAAHLDALRTVADSIGEVGSETTLAGVDNLHGFLTHHLLPHAQAEEAVLYPLVDQLSGVEIATATMRRDHAAISRLTGQLAALRHELQAGAPLGSVDRELRRALYGLHVLITQHFANEDEVYLPMLDRHLDQAAADTVTRQMQDATQAAG